MDSVSFTEHYNQDMASILIEGLYLPHTFFDPLGKLWATVKKWARNKYKIDIAGIFVYDNVKGIISCVFQLSYANVEETTEAILSHIRKFEDSFPDIAREFKSVIECFAEDGAYEEYLAMAQKKRDGLAVSRGEFDRIFNIFLKDLGMRNKASHD